MELFVDLDLKTIETKLEANVVAQLVLIKQVLPGRLERGRGVIINVTSAVATSDPPAPAGQGGWGLGYAITKGALHRVAGILAVELGPQGILAYNVEPGFVVTERMTVNQRALGFEGRYRGSPPSVPGAVIAWLAAGAVADRPDADAGRADTSRADADDGLVPNGTTVAAQKIALERGLHPDWRITPAGA
jgi:NAD(P)-dependent dehydrogenase (short-subunit alcohol dehydrogenase family)